MSVNELPLQVFRVFREKSGLVKERNAYTVLSSKRRKHNTVKKIKRKKEIIHIRVACTALQNAKNETVVVQGHKVGKTGDKEEKMGIVVTHSLYSSGPASNDFNNVT